MRTKLYKISCACCGCEVVATNWLKKYCNECREIVRREQSRQSMNKSNQKKKVKYGTPSKSIRDIIKEVDAYNKEHGTSLSYGQYVLMTEGVNGNN